MKQDSSLKVFHILLYRRSSYKIYYLYRFQLFVSDLIEYEDQGPRFAKKRAEM